MKEEDLDLWIYHLLEEEPAQDGEALAGKTGCSREEVACSLDRLERALLIERRDGIFRVRSIQEMLISCQTRYDDTPFILENGIVKERKRRK